ncbi:hypothetical protein GCM10027088_27130 [Nocardia goodfellowii]
MHLRGVTLAFLGGFSFQRGDVVGGRFLNAGVVTIDLDNHLACVALDRDPFSDPLQASGCFLVAVGALPIQACHELFDVIRCETFPRECLDFVLAFEFVPGTDLIIEAALFTGELEF